MLKRVLIVAAMLVPQVASAADMPRHRPHRHWARTVHRVPPSRYISCTTSNFVLFSTSNCGGGFDPLGVAGL